MKVRKLSDFPLFIPIFHLSNIPLFHVAGIAKRQLKIP
jgi:hypothetical protein